MNRVYKLDRGEPIDEYHYVACHDCRVYGMIPKTSVPEKWHEEWVQQFGHANHDTQWASEYDSAFDARVHGAKVVGWAYPGDPVWEKTGDPPYKQIDNETMNFEWRDED